MPIMFYKERTNSVRFIHLVLVALHSWFTVKATSHTRLRAPDRFISSVLIGGKGGAGPTSFHTTLEGPME